MGYTRREAIKLGAATGAALLLGKNPVGAASLPLQEPQLLKTIPSSGERIPAVGLGTANTFSQAARTPEEHAAIREVVRRFTEQGGKFIDTAPSYGMSEQVLGDLARDVGNSRDVLWATKISGAQNRDAGVMQMERSAERFSPGSVFLNQVHNLGNWQTHIPLLKELKQEGRIRYLGVTTTSSGSYAQLEQIMRGEDIDFVQVDFAIDNREVEDRIFPIARDQGIATIAALPFGRARLFSRTSGVPLPAFAHEFDAHTWAQFFLKYLLSHPDMTVVIPGTSNPNNLVDNMGAGRGRLPDESMRRRMAQFIDDLP